MEATSRGVLKLVRKVSFESKEDGTQVEYYEYYFQTETEEGEPDVLKVNSKQDISQYIDKMGDITVRFNQALGKISLISFKPTK
jgi:hypothetical protein